MSAAAEPASGPRGPFAGTSIAQLARRLRDGSTSALELADAALEAAGSIGAALGGFVTVDDDGARAAAQTAQQELDAGVDRGPLHGIPVAVKDLIATNGLRTTMGSRHFETHIPRADAEVVTRLRQAGAIIVGKTTTHEFAYGPTGDRGLGGPARNPHDPSRMAGGSSGGSAVAVSAGIVPLALGTDTGGSVRIPAALCGVAGLKPTTGSLSTAGVFPLSLTLDVVGPIAASAEDIALAWALLSRGVDETVWRTGPAASSDRAVEGGRRLRVAVVECRLTRQVIPSQRDAVAQAAARLADAGAEVVTLEIPELDACGPFYSATQGPEAYAVHQQRVQDAPDLFDGEVLERLRVASRVEGWRYVQALRARSTLQRATTRRVHRVDVLLLPTVPICAPQVDQRDGDLGAGWRSAREALLALTSPFSLLGWPAMSLPPGGSTKSGSTELPSSVQLAAQPGQEDVLLAAGQQLDDQRPKR